MAKLANGVLVKLLRCKGKTEEECRADECPYIGADGWCDEPRMMRDAADALEAVERQIAELEAQLPKEGEWIHGRELGKEWVYDHWVAYFEDWRCSNCGVVFEQESKPKYHYCPNCGARMR